MSTYVLDLWDSLKIIWLYVRHREEIDNNYPTHWRYDKWVFEISFPEESIHIIPRLQSPIKIINEYFFEEIIDEIYLEITNYEDSKEEFLSFKKEDRLKFINEDKDSFWYSPEILDFSKYPSELQPTSMTEKYKSWRKKSVIYTSNSRIIQRQTKNFLYPLLIYWNWLSTDTHSSRVRKQLKNEKSWISYLRTLRQTAVSSYIKQKEPFWELLFCAEGWKWLPELDSNQWPTG